MKYTSVIFKKGLDPFLVWPKKVLDKMSLSELEKVQRAVLDDQEMIKYNNWKLILPKDDPRNEFFDYTDELYNKLDDQVPVLER